MKMINLEI